MPELTFTQVRDRLQEKLTAITQQINAIPSNAWESPEGHALLNREQELFGAMAALRDLEAETQAAAADVH